MRSDDQNAVKVCHSVNSYVRAPALPVEAGAIAAAVEPGREATVHKASLVRRNVIRR